jgi:hypothetical protein
MASTDLNAFIQIMKKIDDVYGKKLEDIRKLFVQTGQDMLSDFRTRQQGAPEISMRKAGGRNDKGSIAKAIAYAKAHSSNTTNKRGEVWFNRSGRAMRGVHPYVNATRDEITVGLNQTMYYGAYLEYKFNRRYAVLEPLIRAYAPKLLEKARKIMGAN